MSNKEKLIIFDTTLRDGEQSPGADMTQEEKLRVALALERLRVDVIEAGFPAASQGDFESVKKIVSWISPVPGGVGPMTVAMLLNNVLKAYEIQSK